MKLTLIDQFKLLKFSKNINFIILAILLTITINCTTKKKDDGSALSLLLLLEGINISQNAGACTTTSNGAIFTTTAKAISTDNWTHCDLKQDGILVNSTDAWDLRFQRFKISTNSGTSGDKSGGACSKDPVDTNFNQTITTSFCNIKTDTNLSQAGGGSGGSSAVSWSGNPDFLEWYNYKDTILTAKNNVYLIRASNGTTYFQLQFLDYYSSAGTSAYVKFQWKKL